MRKTIAILSLIHHSALHDHLLKWLLNEPFENILYYNHLFKYSLYSNFFKSTEGNLIFNNLTELNHVSLHYDIPLDQLLSEFHHELIKKYEGGGKKKRRSKKKGELSESSASASASAHAHARETTKSKKITKEEKMINSKYTEVINKIINTINLTSNKKNIDEWLQNGALLDPEQEELNGEILNRIPTDEELMNQISSDLEGQIRRAVDTIVAEQNFEHYEE
jgi:hypothetical protein